MISFRQGTGLAKNGKINYKIHSEKARMLYADLRVFMVKDGITNLGSVYG